MSKYYVYTLTNSLTERIFYVGKGTGDRINAHERNARKGDKSPLSAYIRRIWACGGKVIKEKVFETDDEEEALSHETELIGQHRITLVNIMHLHKQVSIEDARVIMLERSRWFKETVNKEQWTEEDERRADRRLNRRFYITVSPSDLERWD